MSQPTEQASPVLYNGPAFHVSGMQIVQDAGEVSLYFTTTRHAFNPNGTEVRRVNEIVTRLVLTPEGALRVAELLAAYKDQVTKAAAPKN
jgi:hypothetical protein